MILQDEQDARQKRKGDGLNSSGHGLTDESDNDELNESELIELPIFLHKHQIAGSEQSTSKRAAAKI